MEARETEDSWAVWVALEGRRRVLPGAERGSGPVDLYHPAGSVADLVAEPEVLAQEEVEVGWTGPKTRADGAGRGASGLVYTSKPPPGQEKRTTTKIWFACCFKVFSIFSCCITPARSASGCANWFCSCCSMSCMST